MGKIVHSSSPDNTALGSETHEEMAVRASIRSFIGIKLLRGFTSTSQKDSDGLREFSISDTSKLQLSGVCVGGVEISHLSHECTKKTTYLHNIVAF